MVIKETVHKSRKMIWGTFKHDDKSVTHFEGREEGWQQWGNTTSKLCETVKRVETLYDEWLTDVKHGGGF